MRRGAGLIIACTLATCSAELVMPTVFGNHMVLQTNSEYGARSFVWGKGIVGETVTVEAQGNTYEQPVAADGTWKVQLNPSSEYTPFTLSVKGSVSTNGLEFADVVFGDVLLCSGQSNMVFPVDQTFKASEILAKNASDGSRFRLLSISRSAQADPSWALPTGQDCSWGGQTPSGLPCGQWVPASPGAVGPFSALCYITALNWAQTTNRPVGVINSAWGGTPVESWMPETAFQMCPQFPPLGPESNRRSVDTRAMRDARATGNVPAWHASEENLRPRESRADLPLLPPRDVGDDTAAASSAARSFLVNQYNDSALFNGMIAPIVGFSIRAAIWDQGERNAVEGWSEERYSCYFGAMINSWRDAWQIGDFAFVYAQLAPYVSDDNITAIRMAQADVLARPGGFMDTTGMTSQLDLGDLSSPYGSVHSRNKSVAAERTSLQLQHVMQGIQDIPFSWPVPAAASLTRGEGTNDGSGSIVSISFDPATLYGGTVQLVNPPNCTACCAGNTTFQLARYASGPWERASAAVTANGMQVQVAPVAPLSWEPAFVRYAASAFPDCVITGVSGIPTVPFVLPMGAPVGPPRSTRFDPHRPLLHPLADQRTLPAEMGGLKRQFVGNVTAPPLYWNSWNAAHCNMDARIAMIQGDVGSKLGMPFANGRGHIVHDDCWQVERFPNGSMRADPVRYPNGVQEVSSYLKGKGVGFGLYTARGSRTCQNRPGSYEHEAGDADFYFAHNITYIKIDDCGGTNWPAANDSWTRFRNEFEAKFGPDRVPVMSVEYCSDPTGCGLWISDTTNMARTTGDIQANIAGILSNADGNSKMASVQTSQCGYFNDADMLEVDAAGVTFNQSIVQLGLWSIMGAPLGISTDVRFLSQEYIDTLTNPELLAVDQDPICAQGGLVIDNGSESTQAWARKLADGSVAVALLNRGASPASLTADFKALGISAQEVTVRDVIRRKDLPDASGSVAAGLAGTSLELYRLTPKQA